MSMNLIILKEKTTSGKLGSVINYFKTSSRNNNNDTTVETLKKQKHPNLVNQLREGAKSVT